MTISNLRILRLRFVDDRLQICFHHVRRQSAQAVVRPELDHEHVDRPLEQPIDSAQTTGAGVAAHARVHRLQTADRPREFSRAINAGKASSFPTP